ncbi:MAG: hypothetical protein JRF63_13395, partial [Deltaproteobacteria bacterium]|nr:hypothetical protein [Deltaproteobacteria bacterium]
IPRLFRSVERIPCNHSTRDNPTWWSTDKRAAGWALRRELTLAFLDEAHDDVVQERFAALYQLISEQEQTSATPRWDELLAGRGDQPGTNAR